MCNTVHAADAVQYRFSTSVDGTRWIGHVIGVRLRESAHCYYIIISIRAITPFRLSGREINKPPTQSFSLHYFPLFRFVLAPPTANGAYIIHLYATTGLKIHATRVYTLYTLYIVLYAISNNYVPK